MDASLADRPHTWALMSCEADMGRTGLQPYLVQVLQMGLSPSLSFSQPTLSLS